MRIAIAASLTGVALLGLSGCHKPAPSATVSAASGADAAAAPPATQAAAAPAAPHPREGLWEEKMTMEGMGFTSTSQICIDKSVEERMVPDVQAARAHCSNHAMNRQLNGDWSFSGTCSTGKAGVVTTTGAIHGDFNTAYTMDLSSTVTGADLPAMNRTMKMTVQATWLGPCKPGQKPGDVVVNGMKMHMPGGRRVDLDGVKGQGLGMGGGPSSGGDKGRSQHSCHGAAARAPSVHGPHR